MNTQTLFEISYNGSIARHVAANESEAIQWASDYSHLISLFKSNKSPQILRSIPVDQAIITVIPARVELDCIAEFNEFKGLEFEKINPSAGLPRYRHMSYKYVGDRVQNNGKIVYAYQKYVHLGEVKLYQF